MDQHETRGRPELPANKRASAWIQLRTTIARKNAYVKAARPGKLSTWVFKWLDKAAGYHEKKD